MAAVLVTVLAVDKGALVAVSDALVVVVVVVVVADEDKVVCAEEGARWERLFLPVGIGLPSSSECNCQITQ